MKPADHRAPISPKWIGEFIRFGLVGTVGFLANAMSVEVFSLFANLYAAGALSWVVAATITWLLNRVWTFADHADPYLIKQWIRFLVANSGGLILYYGAYVVAIQLSELCARKPFLAVFIGSIAGLGANFILSKKLVFTPRSFDGR